MPYVRDVTVRHHRWRMRVDGQITCRRGSEPYTVLRAVLRKYRKWRYSALHRIKILEPINIKTGKLIMSSRSSSVLKLIKIGQAVAFLHCGWNCPLPLFFRIFFQSLFAGTSTANAGRSTPTCYISMDAVWPKNVPFGGFNAKNYFGELFPKNLIIFWPK